MSGAHRSLPVLTHSFPTRRAPDRMAGPTRVRSVLNLAGGAWDPTLAFEMGGAIIPMAVAWVVRGRLDAPVAAPEFTVPGTNPITPRLIGGAMLFGIGWGIAGLCPGPAIADQIGRAHV